MNVTNTAIRIAGEQINLYCIIHWILGLSKQQLKKTAENGLGGTDEESQSFKVAGIYQTQLIVALAMLEAAAFFNLVAMLVEKTGTTLTPELRAELQSALPR